MSKHIYIVFFLFLLAAQGFAQVDKQKNLERKRQSILNEIKQIEVVLFKTRGEKKSLLTEVEDIDQRISARQNLIKVTNQQANYLSRTINNNLAQMEQLREELRALKKDYAAMINKSYKSKSQQSRVLFLLSSESFLQAYKRIQYMKQYTEYRKKQGVTIREKSDKLMTINTDLIAQRKQKDVLISENKKEKKKLEAERKSQESLVATLKKDEGKFASQIKKKQREASKLDKEIDDLIKAAIAKANKGTSVKGNTVSTASRDLFSMTPEARELANSFTSNKGKLPWPVEQGVVVGKFGTHKVPSNPNLTRSNSGVEIATQEDAIARAVFNGEVMEVQQIKGSNKVVMIRHGNYISIYSNLSGLKVKKGDKVTTKQPLGTVSKNAASGRFLMKFYVYKDGSKLNPADWIFRM
ncbi:MAG: septal ring factor EnvC (AmiA/AmiB activator) [Planctomycetota bacterium]|uniref:murein hydrolase activator EnvC family protein n=1 Tax=Patiriisocius sp. Uisw_047 TaxID=3230969 RepID=UPI0039ED02F2